MKIDKNKISNNFKVNYHGLELEFELYELEYIESTLKSLEETGIVFNARTIELPEYNSFKSLREYHKEDDSRYFYSYIKFFEFNKKLYGIVGGKTNYVNPDISFKLDGNSIARNFLRDNNLEYSRKVIIVDHYKSGLDKNIDDYQAKFLEKYLQRLFNLFDS